MLPEGKNKTLRYREGWHDKADMVAVVLMWQQGETALWKEISPSGLKLEQPATDSK